MIRELKTTELISRGRKFRFERRSYGYGATYTWAFVQYNGEWLPLGDPWPVRNPKRSELHEQAQFAITKEKG